MNPDQWTAVDKYLCDLLVPADPALDATLRSSAEAGLPAINVSPAQGKLLHILSRMRIARTILEIGTLAGYSTIWMARALPKDGRLVTLEFDPKHAEIARANIAGAGLGQTVEIVIGPAIDSLPKLIGDSRSPFDLIFIDADKVNTPNYFTWSLRLSRPGTVIIVDNVVREGGIINAASTDPSIQAMRRFNEMLAKEKRVTATAIQTVGSKGYDGFTIAIVNDQNVS